MTKTVTPKAATPKRIVKPVVKAKAVAPAPAAASTPAPKAETTAARPTRESYGFDTGYVGSSGLNVRSSRTAVDFSRFGTMTSAPTTERDETNMKALRKQFGDKPFRRLNLDAGILRRLGERGILDHVAGGECDADATFRLTAKGLGKPMAKAA